MVALNQKPHTMTPVPVYSETIELIHTLFPGEEIAELTPISVGWNSHVYILNQKFVIKTPKTRSAVEGIEKEMALAESLRAYLPVQLPKYVSKAKVGDISGFAYNLIKGKMMTTTSLSGDESHIDPTKISDRKLYSSIQKQLAGILSSIHSIESQPVAEILAKFENETWSESYLRVGKKFDVALQKVFHDESLFSARSLLAETIERIAHCDFQQKFIHGDFGGWNIIYDEDRKEINGILDWADSCIGDPALDFTELIYDYGEHYAREVLGFYLKSNDPTDFMERAKLYLRLEGYRDLHYGVVTNSPEFVAKGIKNIEKMLKGPEE